MERTLKVTSINNHYKKLEGTFSGINQLKDHIQLYCREHPDYQGGVNYIFIDLETKELLIPEVYSGMDDSDESYETIATLEYV